MLQLVLQEIEAAGGTINLSDLSQKLHLEPGALEGMLEFWVRKGRLRREGIQSSHACSSGPSCGGSCAGAACPFIIRIPRTFSLVTERD
jgi:hypothetical protein